MKLEPDRMVHLEPALDPHVAISPRLHHRAKLGRVRTPRRGKRRTGRPAKCEVERASVIGTISSFMDGLMDLQGQLNLLEALTDRQQDIGLDLARRNLVQSLLHLG